MFVPCGAQTGRYSEFVVVNTMGHLVKRVIFLNNRRDDSSVAGAGAAAVRFVDDGIVLLLLLLPRLKR